MILFCDSNYLALKYDPWFKSGGATKQVVAWVEGLKSISLGVKVLGAHDHPNFFLNHPETAVAYKQSGGIPKLRYLYVRIPGLVRGMLRVKPDYIYCGVPSPYAGLLAMIAFILRKRFILRVSNDCFVDDRARRHFGPFRYLTFVLGYRLAHVILCQNKYQLEKLDAKYPGKVFEIGNPYLGETVERPVPYDQRKYVAWIGIFQTQKNLPRLLEIARALPEANFRIAGGNDKKLGKSDRDALDELGKLPNVRFLGFLDKEGVLQLLEESYVLLNTSHYEGFSNTFLEAFSRGTPVCAPRQNDPDQIIERLQLGLTFSNSREACEGIRSFLKDGGAFEGSSRNSLRYMKEHHDLRRQSVAFWNIVSSKKRAEPEGSPVVGARIP